MSAAGEFKPVPGDDPAPEPSVAKPFLDHLEDLRWTLIKMVAVMAVTVLGSFFFARQLLGVVTWPLKRAGIDPEILMTPLEVSGGLGLGMKLAFYAGIVIGAPFLLYFLGQFLLPALTPRERGMIGPALGGGVLLFLGGVALGYFAVIPAGLKFFVEYNQYLYPGSHTQWLMDNYVGFVAQMCLAFGLCFELPLVVLALAKLGIVSARFLRDKRPYVIVLIFIVAALVTPTTDPFNQAVLAVPMCVLYEACIWIAWWMERRKRRESTV